MNHDLPRTYKLTITETPTDEFRPIIITDYIMVDYHVYNMLEQHKRFSKMVEPTTFVSTEQKFLYCTITITKTPLERGETQPPKTEHMPSKNVVHHLQHIDNIKPSELNERTGASVTIVTLKWLLRYCNRVYGRAYDTANIIYQDKHMFIPIKGDSLNRHLVLPSNILEACDALHEIIMRKQQAMN